MLLPYQTGMWSAVTDDVDPHRCRVNGIALAGGLRAKVADAADAVPEVYPDNPVATAMLFALGGPPQPRRGTIEIVAEEDPETGLTASGWVGHAKRACPGRHLAAWPTQPLSLLSHALLATWERGRRGKRTVEDYRSSGGIAGAVAQTAEAGYAELTRAERDAARQLFLRLVHVGKDTANTRRRVHRTELLDHDVLDRFVERRLITVDADTVEISHEALIQAWPRLRDWIDADRAGLRVHRHLSEAAQAWHEGGRDPDALYRGERLTTATEWGRDQAHRAPLNPLERKFLDAGGTRDLAEQTRSRRRTRRLYQLLAALAVLTLLTGTLTVVALEQRARATEERDLAVSRQLPGPARRSADRPHRIDQKHGHQPELPPARRGQRRRPSAPVGHHRSPTPRPGGQTDGGSGQRRRHGRLQPDSQTLAATTFSGKVAFWISRIHAIPP